MKKKSLLPCGWLSLIFMTVLLSLTVSVQAETLVGRVVKVSDGDTFTMLIESKKQVRVRLYGIDAPEMTGSQPYCRQSRLFLSNLIAGKDVTVKVESHDRYGRVVGWVSTLTCKDINLKMIAEGMAWHYAYFDKTPAYADAEKKARAAHKGLWQDKKPVNPYDWRKGHK